MFFIFRQNTTFNKNDEENGIEMVNVVKTPQSFVSEAIFEINKPCMSMSFPTIESKRDKVVEKTNKTGYIYDYFLLVSYLAIK